MRSYISHLQGLERNYLHVCLLNLSNPCRKIRKHFYLEFLHWLHIRHTIVNLTHFRHFAYQAQFSVFWVFQILDNVFLSKKMIETFLFFSNMYAVLEGFNWLPSFIIFYVFLTFQNYKILHLYEKKIDFLKKCLKNLEKYTSWLMKSKKW